MVGSPVNSLLARRPRSRWLGYSVAVVSPSAVFLLVLGLQSGAHIIPLYPFFDLAVLVSAVIGGLLPGLIAVGLSILYVYGFLAPHYAPIVGQRLGWLSLVAFAILGVSVTLIIATLRRKQESVERKQEELERSEAQLRTVVNNITERLYVCDGRGRPLIVNQAFSAFFPVKEPTYPQSFSEGVEVFDLSGRPLPLQDRVISRVLRGEQVRGVELRIRSKSNPNNESIQRFNASPVRDAQGNLIMAVMTSEDITLHKKAEEALIRSEKLAATGRMSATIAHEVNSPLAAMTNALYLASSDPGLQPETKEYLRVANQELRRATDIIRKALGFYRETGSQKPVDFPTLIDEVVELYASKLQQRNITIRHKYKYGGCEGEKGCFVMNVRELRQMISILLANGIDALNDNGTLYIRTSRTSDGNGQRIHLTIADNGRGIRTEHLKRIFEPFFTTKEAVGTGLGLWVTQELVRKYNGLIQVRSQEGRGTVFRIGFPAMSVSSLADD